MNFQSKSLKALINTVIGLAFLLAAVVLPLYAYKIYLKQDYTDFDVYYRAAVRAKNLQWQEIYTLKDGASPFRYAPFFIPFFRPFAEFTLTQAKLIWFFLQYFWFGVGFYFLYQTLRRVRPENALLVTSLSLLFILRLCLDTFTIGQVSALMFAGFSIGLWGWVSRKPGQSALALLIPSCLKIGPFVLMGLFCSARPWERKRALRVAFWALSAVLLLSPLAWSSFHLSHFDINSIWTETRDLWLSWGKIVSGDSSYYDASHYGSQSLKSALLRGVNWNWLSTERAEQIYSLGVLTVCGGLFLFWLLRKPISHLGRGLFFCSGLFAYMWLMPETFKYSLTPLAFPFAFLILTPKKGIFTKFVLLFSILTISLAGKDLIGDALFFPIQTYSLPFLATVLMGLTLLYHTWIHSKPSFLAKLLRDALSFDRRTLGPWEVLPEPQRSKDVSVLVPLPLQSSATLNPQTSSEMISKTAQSFREKKLDFEILLIPFGDRKSAFHPVIEQIQKDLLNLPEVRFLDLPRTHLPEGRGSALRAGFLKSKGNKILIFQLEQPCEASFFSDCVELLNSGYDLIRANRRLPETHFRIPVKVLSLVYGRHRLGLLFNWFLKQFLPIQTSDTHSGNLGVSWRLAAECFAVQSSSGFLFDLELSLTSLANSYQEKDLPVTVFLEAEKSSRRVILETLSILRGLPVLAWRLRRGCYHRFQQIPTGITADDWGISAGVNQGILKLARLGVVRRTSLMANCAYLHEGLTELKSLPNLQLGLHFNLTYGRPLKTFRMGYSPASLLLAWLNPFSRGSLLEQVRSELRAQLEVLKKLNVSIQYLDGHQHIHLLPGLIECVADILREYGIRQVRLPYDRKLWFTSRAPLLVLSLIASQSFKKLGLNSLPCIYPPRSVFSDQGMLRQLLKSRLSGIPGTEVIVHPAEVNDMDTLEFPDSYTAGRVTEFHALRMLGIHL